MELYLDTSTPVCKLKLDDNYYEWESGYELAEGLHKFIADKLAKHHKTWQDITKITYITQKPLTFVRNLSKISITR